MERWLRMLRSRASCGTERGVESRARCCATLLHRKSLRACAITCMRSCHRGLPTASRAGRVRVRTPRHPGAADPTQAAGPHPRRASERASDELQGEDQVQADGVLLTCEPAVRLPLAQRYFLFGRVLDRRPAMNNSVRPLSPRTDTRSCCRPWCRTRSGCRSRARRCPGK